jgi:hypothetical protein
MKDVETNQVDYELRLSVRQTVVPEMAALSRLDTRFVLYHIIYFKYNNYLTTYVYTCQALEPQGGSNGGHRAYAGLIKALLLSHRSNLILRLVLYLRCCATAYHATWLKY